jgi:hypothetical protein
MAIWNPKTKKFFCECGCGEEIPPWNSYKPGHWAKTTEGREKVHITNKRRGEVNRKRKTNSSL